MCCTGGINPSPNMSFIIGSSKESNKICTRDDLLIFNDIGMSESSLIKVKVLPKKKKKEKK
jgi:hypothetical protein